MHSDDLSAVWGKCLGLGARTPDSWSCSKHQVLNNQSNISAGWRLSPLFKREVKCLCSASVLYYLDFKHLKGRTQDFDSLVAMTYLTALVQALDTDGLLLGTTSWGHRAGSVSVGLSESTAPARTQNHTLSEDKLPNGAA